MAFLIAHHSSIGFDFSRVIAVSGSGQQHGSVYWKKGKGPELVLGNLDPSWPLAPQLTYALDRIVSLEYAYAKTYGWDSISQSDILLVTFQNNESSFLTLSSSLTVLPLSCLSPTAHSPSLIMCSSCPSCSFFFCAVSLLPRNI